MEDQSENTSTGFWHPVAQWLMFMVSLYLMIYQKEFLKSEPLLLLVASVLMIITGVRGGMWFFIVFLLGGSTSRGSDGN